MSLSLCIFQQTTKRFHVSHFQLRSSCSADDNTDDVTYIDDEHVQFTLATHSDITFVDHIDDIESIQVKNEDVKNT